MDDEDDLQPDSPPGFVEEIDSSELEQIEVKIYMIIKLNEKHAYMSNSVVKRSCASMVLQDAEEKIKSQSWNLKGKVIYLIIILSLISSLRIDLEVIKLIEFVLVTILRRKYLTVYHYHSGGL